MPFKLTDLLEQKAHEVENILQKRFDQDIFLSTLAREVALNDEYLRLAFKAVYGISVSKYLRMVRLQKVCELLKNPLLDIEQIATRVNFSDATNLTHAFRKQYGMPPGVNRRKRIDI